MDVKALYPSIDVDFAVEKVGQLILESDMKFTNINTKELGLLIALIEIEENIAIPEELIDFCPKRKRKGGRPKITGAGSSTNKESRWEMWHETTKEPDSLQTRQMMIHALKYSITYTLKNHICKFKGKLYKQKRGGAIEVCIAGQVATTFMIWWDRVKEKVGRRRN